MKGMTKNMKTIRIKHAKDILEHIESMTEQLISDVPAAEVVDLF